MTSYKHLIAGAGAIVLTVSALSACSDDKKSAETNEQPMTVTTPPTTNPAITSFDEAVRATLAAESVAISVYGVVDGGSEKFRNAVFALDGSVEVKSGDAMAIVSHENSDDVMQYEIRMVGGTLYKSTASIKDWAAFVETTSPSPDIASIQWVSLDPFAMPLLDADLVPRNWLTNVDMLTEATEIVEVGRETSEGSPTTHYTATMTGAALAAMYPNENALPNGMGFAYFGGDASYKDVALDVWLDEQQRVVKVMYTMYETVYGGIETPQDSTVHHSVTILISSFDSGVDAEQPDHVMDARILGLTMDHWEHPGPQH